MKNYAKVGGRTERPAYRTPSRIKNRGLWQRFIPRYNKNISRTALENTKRAK